MKKKIGNQTMIDTVKTPKKDKKIDKEEIKDLQTARKKVGGKSIRRNHRAALDYPNRRGRFLEKQF